MLCEEVNDTTASLDCGAAAVSGSAGPGQGHLSLYINSPGGSVTAGMAIYDTMQYIKCDVSTICIGMAASMGAFLLSSGAKGKRYRAAERRDHDPSAVRRRAGPGHAIWRSTPSGSRDIKEQHEPHPGREHRQAARDGHSRTAERDNFMTAEEAVRVRPDRQGHSIKH